MTNRLLLALKEIVDWLEKQQIPYMIFGGIANTLYGNPRQTFDIDIKISIPSKKEKTDFIEQLRSIAVLLPADPMQFITETSVLPVTLHDVRIDFVFAQLPFEEQAIERSRSELFFPVPMKVCTVEDFILQKAVSTRKKDWDDIETVIDLQKNALDWPYLLEHCRELSDFLNDSTIVTRSSKHAMKNEKKNIHALRERMSRFNNWERTYIKNLSREERFRQFAELFELGISSDRTTIENAHREHLEQLSRLARTKRQLH